MKVYKIKPVPKPRMTQSDKWKKRPCVLRYFKFKDQVKEINIEVPESASHIHFYIQMPKSWSKKKRDKMLDKPHQQRPDKDNLEKALLDAIFKEDCRVFDGRTSKWWNDEPMIIIESIEAPINPIKQSFINI